jgi:folate-binding protein YgfZ
MSVIQYCPRPDLALLRVTGADARGFLHAQTTQEINGLPQTETRLAAWLNAKGRILAVFDVVPAADGFWLITTADSATWLAEQLRRYVLRSAVDLAVPADREVYSLVGLTAGSPAAGDVELTPGQAIERDGVHLVCTAASTVTLFGDRSGREAILGGLTATGSDRAERAEIAAGRPLVPASLRERYTPHMLNLERLGAVSFTKGCYPGQEIVARTENLGSVKRRLKRFACGPGVLPEPGDEIIDAEDQSIGEINRAAATESGFELLAVVPVDPNDGAFRLEQDGRSLTALPLPFEG